MSLLPNVATEGAFNGTWWDSTNFSNPQSDPLKEVIRVSSTAGDTLNIIRAQEGTTASNKNTGGSTYKIVLAFTKKTYDDFANAITSISASVTNVKSFLLMGG